MSRRRLFFALWPDQDTRRAIVARRKLLPEDAGDQVPDYNLHMTLLFLGECPEGSLREIQAAAGELRVPAFDLLLDRFGCFPGARVLWLGGGAPKAADELVGGLTGAMKEIVPELNRGPWRPHVTLFRKTDTRPDSLPDPEPVNWPVTGFGLVESLPGRPYQVLRTWPLIISPDVA